MKEVVKTDQVVNFDYEAAFEAFLSATTQKNDTAKIIGLLINELLKELNVGDSGRLINVADLGCADGKTSDLYLSEVDYPDGFSYTGVDIFEQYLSSAKEFLSKNRIFKQILTLSGDIFHDNLTQIQLQSKPLFDVIFVSHSAYYMREEEYGRFIREIIKCLNTNGIAIFIHEKLAPDTCGYFRKKYNSVYSGDVPSTLNSALSQEGIDIFDSIIFNSQLSFGEIPETYWSQLDDPLSSNDYVKNKDFINFFNKLCFIVQDDLKEMYRKSTLSSYLAETSQALRINNNCINITSSIQIVVSPSFQHHSSLSRIIDSIKNKLENGCLKNSNLNINTKPIQENMKMMSINPQAIISGKFNYEESFKIFLESTTQKSDSAHCISFFINKLLKSDNFKGMNDPLNILDVGCANGSSCLLYLSNVNYHEFNYFGIDISEHYLSEARLLLSGQPRFKSVVTEKVDAFNGELANTGIFFERSFDIIFVSHSAYHMDPKNYQIFIKDMQKLLTNNGVVIFLHQKLVDNSFAYFGMKYGAFSSDDAPLLLNEALNEQKMKCFQHIEFISKFNYGLIAEYYWDLFKDPENYHKYVNHENFVNLLNRLAFMVQRDFIEMIPSGVLSMFLDETRKVLNTNNNCIDMVSYFQVIASPLNENCQKIERTINETMEEVNLKFQNTPPGPIVNLSFLASSPKRNDDISAQNGHIVMPAEFN